MELSNALKQMAVDRANQIVSLLFLCFGQYPNQNDSSRRSILIRCCTLANARSSFDVMNENANTFARELEVQYRKTQCFIIPCKHSRFSVESCMLP